MLIVEFANPKRELSSGKRLLDLMMQKYALRQATILELMEAQESFESAGYRLMNLQFAAKAAEIKLLCLAGQLK